MAELVRCVGDGSTVIPAGCCNHPGLRHLGTQNAIEGAARFEGPGMLQGFQLEKDPRIHIKAIVFKRNAWCAPDVPRDSPSGVLNLHA
jgi:hypothetical protein